MNGKNLYINKKENINSFIDRIQQNEHFWKFWPFCFKHCTRCQISMVNKEKKLVVKQWLNFKVVEEQRIFNHFEVNLAIWSNSKNVANLLWITLPLTLWRLPIIKLFKLLSWKLAGSFFIEPNFSWHQNVWLKW